MKILAALLILSIAIVYTRILLWPRKAKPEIVVHVPESVGEPKAVRDEGKTNGS